MKQPRIALTLFLVAMFTLSGCALSPDGHVTGAGSASYEYKRTLADGSTCSVIMLSGRDVIGGALTIDKDCAVTSKADSTAGTGEAITVIGSSISAIREIAAKVP